MLHKEGVMITNPVERPTEDSAVAQDAQGFVKTLPVKAPPTPSIADLLDNDGFNRGNPLKRLMIAGLAGLAVAVILAGLAFWTWTTVTGI
jgi:hypothetical protein